MTPAALREFIVNRKEACDAQYRQTGDLGYVLAQAELEKVLEWVESDYSPLAILRQRAGLSQQGLADRLGVSQATVSRIESGEYGVDRYLAGLAKALGVSETEVREAANRD